MMLNLSLILLGLSVWQASCSVIEVAQGSKLTLPCQMTNGFFRCHWLHNMTTIYSDHPANNTNPLGYSIVGNPNNGNCSLEIVAVKLEDHGVWNCFMPNNTGDKLVDLNLLVPPAANHLLLEGRPLTAGESKTVRPDPIYGQVRVQCISIKGKPAPTIKWEVNGAPEEADEALSISSNPDNQTFNALSTITLQYEVFTQQNSTVYQIESEADREKIVRCIINHKVYKDPTILSAILGMEYATTTCQLTLHRIHGNDSEVLLICEANGVPEPTYTIQKLTADSDIIESVMTGQNHSVTESGIYICEATYQEKHSVRSDQVIVNISKPETSTTPRSTTSARTTRGWTSKRSVGTSIMESARMAIIYSLALISLLLGLS